MMPYNAETATIGPTKWSITDDTVSIALPAEFDFTENLVFLNRSPLECLHVIKRNQIYKLLDIAGKKTLVKVGYTKSHTLTITFLNQIPNSSTQTDLIAYILEWLDLQTDLSLFYRLAAKDKLLNNLIQTYYGLRLIGIPDLFEALVWAIIGQQINLNFAYQLKKNLVELVGETLLFDNQLFWLFPTPSAVVELTVENLRKLKITRNKAEYILNVANQFTHGQISKQALLDRNNVEQVQKVLLSLRGVGPWTASYVAMKCLRFSTAFPITDVGLHNALKRQLGITKKPAIEEIMKIASRWTGWEAYATFYLWRSLL